MAVTFLTASSGLGVELSESPKSTATWMTPEVPGRFSHYRPVQYSGKRTVQSYKTRQPLWAVLRKGMLQVHKHTFQCLIVSTGLVRMINLYKFDSPEAELLVHLLLQQGCLFQVSGSSSDSQAVREQSFGGRAKFPVSQKQSKEQ